ncbi:2-oxo acid dehydrogenase subunit E2 [Streptomyces sp. NPDC001985]|uniref:2-oxo acid dehydrogenase subunit E2 n=1 Tax=Streptomyces sp. NPDC001985 TaxID=3154406 RepID=UPI00331B11FF
MTGIRIPRFNSNDESYVLVEWLAEDGGRVAEGEPVAVIETSKATVELDSPADGVVQHGLPEHTECAVGDVVAVLHPDEAAHRAARDRPPAPAAPDVPAGPALTRGARELAAGHGIGAAELAATGRKLLKRADIERLLAARAPAPAAPAGTSRPPGGTLRPLSAAQRAVAATVSASHRTVPTAYVAVRARVDRALERAAGAGRTHGALIGLPELLIAAVASLRERFPYCFATLVDDTTVELHDTAAVGVTIDTGDGLYVAAVHRAETLDCVGIARLLMEFRLRSLRRDFRAEDLAGSNVVVSLHNDPGVVLARPIVFPGHSCAVVLPGVQEEVFLDEAGAPAVRRTVQLGLSYDHRVLNGREATRFLLALRELLEAPEALLPAGPGPAAGEVRAR